MSNLEQHKLITDYLHPANPIFSNKHKLGNTFVGPGDSNCVLCKGVGVILGIKCTCQDNYLVQLINYAAENQIELVMYYGVQITDSRLDEIFRS